MVESPKFEGESKKSVYTCVRACACVFCQFLVLYKN